MSISDISQSQVVEYLKSLKPGVLPLELFIEFTRLVTTPVVEIVPLRLNSQGQVEVLMTVREASDPIWGGLYHTTGTVIRSTDTPGSFADAFNRLRNGELKGTQTTEPVFVTSILRKVKRGTEVAMVHWVEVIGKPTVGEFFTVENLPENIVDTQKPLIEIATKAFLNKINL